MIKKGVLPHTRLLCEKGQRAVAKDWQGASGTALLSRQLKCIVMGN
jgi:hypothetical protein